MTEEEKKELDNLIHTLHIHNIDTSILFKMKDTIQKQQEEIEKKDKIIGKMIDNIMTDYQVKTMRKMCCPPCKIGEKACTYSGIHRNCIKQYFERGVVYD